ncbi:wax ester/triacylglycerol synthase domain-containing protein [Hamadaea sp. NPDC051192]|uniref:wax ester/triacylglycerol synthase domain-containing protein n=1 Tax=Hamadaea sp. NPDC051192 TaxID=3154940 RepID=UPI00341F8139
MRRIERLTPTDLINLYVESPSSPARVGALALLDRPVELGTLRRRIVDRVAGAPRLRQVVYRPGWLGGRPIWVDSPKFDVGRHVRSAVLPAGVRLTDFAVRLANRPFARDLPPWRIWLVTGLPDGSAALVFAMHHVVADGLTTIRMFAALADDAPAVPAGRTLPRPPWVELVRDNVARRLAGLRTLRRPSATTLRQMAGLRNAPRTSLNGPVGAHRRLDAVTLDLDRAKETAHRHGAKVNDVVLTLAAGGLRALLRSRSEPTDGVELHATVAVSVREAGASDGGNRTGGFAVRVPLTADVHRRLEAIARETAVAKGGQAPTAGNALLIGLSRLGVLRWFSRRQRMINFMESDVIGPAAPVRLLGATVLEVVPIGTVVGNMTIGFLAVSYAGRLVVAVQADADRHPDLPVLLAAMCHEADQLAIHADQVLHGIPAV